MKKASSILYLVGAIVSIILIVTFGALASLYIVFALPEFKNAIIEGLQNGSIKSSIQGTPEEVATAIQHMFVIMGTIFSIVAAFNIVNTVICFLSRKVNNHTNSVLNIIFGLLSFTEVNAIGGIFGLIDERIEDSREEE